MLVIQHTSPGFPKTHKPRGFPALGVAFAFGFPLHGVQASSLVLTLEGFVFWGYSMLLNGVKRRGEAKLLHHCYNKVQKELYVAERNGVVG